MSSADRVGMAPSYIHDGGGGNNVQVAYNYPGGMASQARYSNPANAAAYGGYVSPVSSSLKN
jgi:hypothetical protein